MLVVEILLNPQNGTCVSSIFLSNNVRHSVLMMKHYSIENRNYPFSAVRILFSVGIARAPFSIHGASLLSMQ